MYIMILLSKISYKLYIIKLCIFYSPFFFIIHTHRNSSLLKRERKIWIKEILNSEEDNVENFLALLSLREYRTVFYFRTNHEKSFLLNLLYPGEQTAHIRIESDKVKEGFILQHGHSTRVNAKSIGEKCQIWHNVTVGTNKSHSGNLPTIGNNVKICTGSIVIGDIKIGNNVIIGAGSIVVKDVPDNCVIVGNPAHIIKYLK